MNYTLYFKFNPGKADLTKLVRPLKCRRTESPVITENLSYAVVTMNFQHPNEASGIIDNFGTADPLKNRVVTCNASVVVNADHGNLEKLASDLFTALNNSGKRPARQGNYMTVQGYFGYINFRPDSSNPALWV